MSKKNQNKFFIISALIAVFIVVKLMWWTTFISLFLTVSLPLLFLLWRTTWKLRIFAIMAWLLLIWIDFFLMILLIVPTNSFDIQTKNYYKQKENYMKIYIKDDKEKLSWMAILIKKKDQNRTKHLLTDYKQWDKIKLEENDKIYFVWRKENKTYAVIYLWDDSILRITPWTKLDLQKITKNLDNMTDNETHIELEQWNIWFHIIKMVKDSSNMQINTWKWQTLIIRWTAWIVSKNENETQVIWYSHFIEVKDKDKSRIISKWEWAIIKQDSIEIVQNIKDMLKNIWIDNSLIEEFKSADKKYIENTQKELINYIKKQVWTLSWFVNYNKLKEWKIKIFSIWDRNYKEYAKNLINYEYLIWEWKKFTSKLSENGNLVFLASQLEKQKVKTAFLYDQLKNNIQNSDYYKTYIINLWIEWRIKDINKALKENVQSMINRYSNNYNQIFKDTDNWIDSLINKYLNF